MGPVTVRQDLLIYHLYTDCGTVREWHDRPTTQEDILHLNVLDSVQHIFIRSRLNVLLVFVPFGIAAHLAGLKNPTIDFALNAVAILPLTALLTYATENVASTIGTGPGALLNIVFGNLVELVIL